MPRTKEASTATESGQPIIGPGLPAAGCVALGVGAPAVLTALGRAVHTVTSVDLLPQVMVGNLTIIPAHTNFAPFSPTYLTVFLVAVLIVPIVIHVAGRPVARSRRTPVWDGGILTFKPRMQYSAMTFAAPVRVTFDRLYRPTVTMQRASHDLPDGRDRCITKPRSPHCSKRYLYGPVIAAAQYCARLVTPIQSGNVNLYLLYVFLVLLAYLFGALGSR
jgi:hydrogenase-4 component B